MNLLSSEKLKLRDTKKDHFLDILKKVWFSEISFRESGHFKH